MNPSLPPEFQPRRQPRSPGRTPCRRVQHGAALLIAAACLQMLGGCTSGLLPKPPAAPILLSLDAGSAPAVASVPRPGAMTLVVEMPRAAPGFDTRDMAYVRRPHQIEYFAQHQWADKPAQMLAPLIVGTLQSSAVFSAVLLAPTGASGALRLETDLLRLQQDFTRSPSQVQLTLRAALIDVNSRRVMASRQFDIRLDAPSDDAYGGAVAANRAVAQWLAELASFSAQALPR